MGKAAIDGDKYLTIYTDPFGLPIYDSPFRLKRAVFALCQEGEITVDVDFVHYSVRKNDFMLLAPGQLLQGRKFSDDFQGFSFAISRELTDEKRVDMQDVLPLFFYLQDTPMTHITDEEMELLSEYLYLLQKKSIDDTNYYRRELVHNLIRAFLFELSNILRSRAILQNKKKSRKEIQFEEFLLILQKHFKEKRTVLFYADKVGLSPKHLSRVIKEVSNKSVPEWIDGFVIMEAKSLLKDSRMTIEQVSIELNFANQSFFGRYFKHHTGMTPSEYRNS